MKLKTFIPSFVCAVLLSGIQCGAQPSDRTPFERELPVLEKLRVWARSWTNLELEADKSFTVPLRFTFVPWKETWQRPGGAIEPATGTDQDIIASGYDVIAEILVERAKQLEINLCGRKIVWDCAKQELNGLTPVPEEDGKLRLRVVVDQTSFRVMSSDGVTILTDHVSRKIDRHELTITPLDGKAAISRLDVYGLRDPEATVEESQLAAKAAADGRIFYKSHSYTVYGGRVEDDIYGPPAAYVPDSNTIVSPTRVIEGFEQNLDIWRPDLQGRVIDHHTIWHPNSAIKRFPTVRTDWPTVDMAYRVALDVLHRCSSEEFISKKDDLEKWQAGFFMGQHFGFGIWMRDSTHVALRAGNLIDSKVARNTLLQITKEGIDNGCDGVAMPIVGLWDYYRVTGDESVIHETWGQLKALTARIDAQFVESMGLIKAEHSTSNDHFKEPEAGGFALGTEAYFLLTYQAMAEMGRVMKEDESLIKAWTAREALLRENIRKLYWKDSAGFFTTGPQGSEGYEKDFWESSGQELAIWPRFNIASSEQRRRVLDRLPEVAMNEFGVDVFPYRTEVNHFCGAGWVVWTAGISAAANREGRLDLIQHLIGQQVRNAVINKTFYEVIDYKSGRAWRWPGQLWQAAGFLSYFYFGVLGMDYTADGMTLNPAVPESLTNMQLVDFPYRKAVLDIQVKGWGTAGELFLDGVKVNIIPTNLEGRHSVELRVKPQLQDKSRILKPLPTGGHVRSASLTKAGAIECETMKIVRKSNISAAAQDMSPWDRNRWSNGEQMLMTARRVGDFVEVKFPAPDAKPRQLVLHATQSIDYGTLRFSVNGKPSAAIFDGYASEVRPAEPLQLGVFMPENGHYTVRAEVTGANLMSIGARYFFGLDCIVLEESRETF